MWNVSIFYFNSTPLEKRKRHNYRLSNPTLIERALLIQEISSSLILPIYFFNRLLSIVVICSNNAIDGMDNAEWELSWQWVGILALWWICPVITATITVGLNLFPVLFWIIRTGRYPLCSAPIPLFRLAQKISPRIMQSFRYSISFQMMCNNCISKCI